MSTKAVGPKKPKKCERTYAQQEADCLAFLAIRPDIDGDQAAAIHLAFWGTALTRTNFAKAKAQITGKELFTDTDKDLWGWAYTTQYPETSPQQVETKCRELFGEMIRPSKVLDWIALSQRKPHPDPKNVLAHLETKRLAHGKQQRTLGLENQP